MMTYLGEKFLGQASQARDSARHVEGLGIAPVRRDVGNEIAEASVVVLHGTGVTNRSPVHEDQQHTRCGPRLHGVEPPRTQACFHVRDGHLQHLDVFLGGLMHTKWDLKIVSLHTSDAMLASCSPSSSNAVPAWPADNTSSPCMMPAYREAAQPRSSTAQRETPAAATRQG